LEYLQQVALVEAVTLGCVSICLEESVVRLEAFVRLLSRALQDDDHETSHEEGTINHLVWFFRSAIVKHPIFLIVLILE